jgi:hypothetical protein
VDLIEIDVVDTERRRDASTASRMCPRDRPPSLGALPIRMKTLVASTYSSRRAKTERSAAPVASSLTPTEYMSAVSKKVMPPSAAAATNSSARSPGSTQSRQPGSP